MSKLSQHLVEQVKAAAAGLSHAQREWLGLELASVAAGEEVQFLRCERGTMTAWLRPEGERPLSQVEKDSISDMKRRFFRNELPPAEQIQLKQLLDRQVAELKQARSGGGR
jgi:hypothetical protein